MARIDERPQHGHEDGNADPYHLDKDEKDSQEGRKPSFSARLPDIPQVFLLCCRHFTSSL